MSPRAPSGGVPDHRGLADPGALQNGVEQEARKVVTVDESLPGFSLPGSPACRRPVPGLSVRATDPTSPQSRDESRTKASTPLRPTRPTLMFDALIRPRMIGLMRSQSSATPWVETPTGKQTSLNESCVDIARRTGDVRVRSQEDQHQQGSRPESEASIESRALPLHHPFGFAQIRVALLISSSESFHNPLWDCREMITHNLDAQVDVYTEKTFEQLLASQRDYDCLVIGHNAVSCEPHTQQCLRDGSLHGNVVVLQQRRLRASSHLLNSNDLTLQNPEEQFAFDEIEAVDHARVPVDRDADMEPIFWWPNPVDLGKTFPCMATHALTPSGTSSWRTILASDTDRPLLVRSPQYAERRVVVTSLLLESHTTAHAQLMANMVAYAATGGPSVIVASRNRRWSESVSRKLRAYGATAVILTVGEIHQERNLRFDRWPLAGAKRVYMPDTDAKRLQDDQLFHEWADQGGTLVEVESTGVARSMHYGRDAEWLALRFSSYLRTSNRAWRNSLLALSSVTTALRQFSMHIPEDRRHALGLFQPAELVDESRELVQSRLHGGAVDNTVSTTIATFDLDRALNEELLSDGARKEIRRWLETRFPAMSLEDQLDTIRVLQEPELFAGDAATLPATRDGRHVAHLNTQLRVRECLSSLPIDVVYRSQGLRDLLEPMDNAVSIELVGSLLLSARYIQVTANSSITRKVSDAESALLDTAIATVRKRGVDAIREQWESVAHVGRESANPALTAEEAANLSVALLTLDDPQHPARGTAELVDFVPKSVVSDVLRQSSALFSENARVHCRITELESTLAEARRVASATFMTLTVLLAGAIVWAVQKWGQLGGLGDVFTAATAIIALCAAGAYALKQKGLLAPWLARPIVRVTGFVRQTRHWASGEGE